MTPNLTPAASRALALGILALLLLLAGWVALWPIQVLQGYDAEIAALQGQLRDLDARGQPRAALEKAKISLVNQDPGSQDTIPGRTSGLAGAELQRLVTDLIERLGGRLDSTQVLPTRQDGHFIRIGLRVNMSTDIASLREVLHTLESGRPRLFIDTLRIRAREKRGSRDDVDPVTLAVSFDLYGYMSREAA